MATIDGEFQPEFARMATLLSESLATGEDVGASVCATVDGETVVDIWGGYVDAAHSAPWRSDTITNVWSTTKPMTSLCALLLVERGELDVDAAVAQYWPEFGANGKEGVTVRHLLSHTSGVSAWEQPIQTSDIYDWDVAVARLAAQPLWWEPGTASGYHALNYGHLIGEVVRRISGRSLGTFFAEEVAGPLKLDFHIGLSPGDFGRVSNVIPPPPLPIDMASIDTQGVMFKTFTGPAPQAEASWTPEWRSAEIGGANGHGNARSVARAQAIVANGGTLDGIQFLSPKTIDLIFAEQAAGVDLVLGEPVRFGLGYGLKSESMPFLADGRACYWGGWGGSVIIVDVDRRLTMSYVMNKMGPGLLGDARSQALIQAVYEAVDS